MTFSSFCKTLALVGVASTSLWAKANSTDDFYSNMTRLNKVMEQVSSRYVEDVDSKELIDAAIEGLSEVLDPHTAVFSPKDYDNLKVSTDGEFGGLGITIAIRDKILTIITPLQGTPAFSIGLQAGDRIIKINGEDTKGISINDAVDKLRGKIGTDVTIGVARTGRPELIDFTVTRDKIVIHSVPYYGMLNTDVGYIKVAQFAKHTGRDVRLAIETLKKQGMQKLVFDLRYNPGGLLSQAIEVSDLFLPKGNVIVSTKGRVQKSEARAENDAILPKDFPVVTLVNQGSASASEIVSGALQDWDRSIVMGKTSFGKGSVQTINQLDNKGNAIKLTTAFYYLPMGRCINKPENGIRDEAHLEVNDSLAQDSTVQKEVFYTNAGRKVYGGGGIAPDIEIESNRLAWMEQIIERQALFFKFAVSIRTELEKSGIKISETWEVSDKIMKQFEQYASKDTVFAKTKGASESSFDLLNEVLQKEKEWEGDTIRTEQNELELSLQKVKEAFANRRTKALQSQAEYIRRGVKREILGVFKGDEARTAFNLTTDKQVLEAIKVLSDSAKYKKLLSKQAEKK